LRHALRYRTVLELEVAPYRFRGRIYSTEQIASMRALIAAHPDSSRRRLSALLCEAWNWRQENGALRDMLARGMMLDLHRKGLIELPPRRWKNPNPLVLRASRPKIEIDMTSIECALAELRPLEFRLVRRTKDEPLFDSLIAEHHYLGFTRPVGEHLKYLVVAKTGRPIACLAFSSAPRHLAPRDRYIGWSAAARKANLRYVAYNPRYLILPWVKVEHLASHVLGQIARRLPSDWAKVYGHGLYFLETFIDPPRFKGTCYRAANFVAMGLTTGRGKQDNSKKPNRSLKEVLGYPLVPDFRARLSRLSS
jgi:Domain of unknown function (DUF4338)